MMNISEIIVMASDHAGFFHKEFLKNALTEKGYQIKDMGTYSSERVDYPDMIHPLAKAISEDQYQTGIIICGSGNGVAMVANKYPNVRCALCWNVEIARLARNHNNANIISLPARFVTQQEALEILTTFLESDYDGGRHQQRIDKINIL